MMHSRMSRFLRLISLSGAVLVVVFAVAACGEAYIHVPKSDPTYKADYAAAVVFHERCGGCHTLSYAATEGSGDNPRTYLNISGPNFNVRCERPVARVLYAIENGGFSGAYMPANIVVGQQAREVAMFVAKFAGRQAPQQPGVIPCAKQPMGQLPASLTGGVTIAKSNLGPASGESNPPSSSATAMAPAKTAMAKTAARSAHTSRSARVSRATHAGKVSPAAKTKKH
jgi:mono/diheme cytochrome c family protein